MSWLQLMLTIIWGLTLGFILSHVFLWTIRLSGWTKSQGFLYSLIAPLIVPIILSNDGYTWTQLDKVNLIAVLTTVWINTLNKLSQKVDYTSNP